MNITAFLDTLPINYYTQDGINYSRRYDEGADTYINMETNEITIGLGMFDQLENVTESSVRTLFYHEVSHAILTDMELLQTANFTKELIEQYATMPVSLTNGELRDVLNIIEDERIETILADYYIDVNFKQFVTEISANSPEADTAMSIFWNETRLETGSELNALIHDRLTAVLKAEPTAADYAQIVAVYNDIKAISNNNQSEDNQGEGEGDGDGEGQGQPSAQEIADAIKNGNFEIAEGDNQGQTVDMDELDQEAKDIVKAAMAGKRTKQERKVIFKASKDNYNVDTLIKKLVQRTKAKDGIKTIRGARHGYMGTPDVHKMVNMKDNAYKVFTTKGANNLSNNKFKINFYIDESGSFCDNEKAVNALLAKCIKLEKDLAGAFEFTLTTIETKETVKTGDDRYIKTRGGTEITKQLRDIYTKNYDEKALDILLLDGYACTEEALDYLDKKNMYIMVDRDNDVHFKGFRRARVELVNSSFNYAKGLEQFVCRALSSALRTA